MSFWKNLRKIGTPTDQLKRLIEDEQKAVAEKEPDDAVAFQEGRLDFENIAFSDDYEVNPNTEEDNEGYALNDTETHSLQVAGAFQITDDSGAGAGVTQPGIIQFSDIGAGG